MTKRLDSVLRETLWRLFGSRKFLLLHEFLVIAACVYTLTHDALFVGVLSMPFLANMFSIAIEDTTHVSVIQTGENAKVEQASVGTNIEQSKQN